MSHGHDNKHAAHASGDKTAAYGNLAAVEVEKLGNFSSGAVLEASKWASVNDPNPTGTLQSPALLAMSKVLGSACIEYNAAFFECKARTRNPEKCEKEGVAVTACAKNVYAARSLACSIASSGCTLRSLASCLISLTSSSPSAQFATRARALPAPVHRLRQLPQLEQSRVPLLPRLPELFPRLYVPHPV